MAIRRRSGIGTMITRSRIPFRETSADLHRHGQRRLGVAPMSSVAPRRLTGCEQLTPTRQRAGPKCFHRRIIDDRKE
jgi:hypothetical protein